MMDEDKPKITDVTPLPPTGLGGAPPAPGTMTAEQLRTIMQRAQGIAEHTAAAAGTASGISGFRAEALDLSIAQDDALPGLLAERAIEGLTVGALCYGGYRLARTLGVPTVPALIVGPIAYGGYCLLRKVVG